MVTFTTTLWKQVLFIISNLTDESTVSLSLTEDRELVSGNVSIQTQAVQLQRVYYHQAIDSSIFKFHYSDISIFKGSPLYFLGNSKCWTIFFFIEMNNHKEQQLMQHQQQPFIYQVECQVLYKILELVPKCWPSNPCWAKNTKSHPFLVKNCLQGPYLNILWVQDRAQMSDILGGLLKIFYHLNTL